VTITVQWGRFLVASVAGSILVLALYMIWQMTPFVAAMSVGYPARPPAEAKPLVPFLFAASLIQLVVFCYLYLRVYPRRGLANAIWWGAWAGLFMVIPDGQFFVGTPNMGWGLLALQMGAGIVTAILLMIFFQLAYRPKDERWAPAPTDWRRFLIFGGLGAVLVFLLDISFHQHLAQVLFDEYPAHDFPRRPPDEAVSLLPWLFVTYLVQLSLFCFLFVRIYPRRGMGSAIWFGAWLGLWVVIPNMEFFVGLDKFTWHMLAIQVPEGMSLTIMLMIFFEWAYRPKPRRAGLAAAA
jgi:hypothetical protein